MIDAEIELVVNPGGVDAVEQRQRLVDQVVVIEQATPRLLLPVAPQNGVGDGDQRRRSDRGRSRRAGAPAMRKRGFAPRLAAQPSPYLLIALLTIDLRGVRSLAVQKMSR